ncbi:DUF6691 family protein [Pontixanthobacter aquaemixtae]|uniref:YeeE/YedE family protein n=1 Tax=Pontixanthobacter aquaemixtae TaxID=1958940 RepID=A0A844ZQB6_9SPHN|nr:DUF6691 family protein [Pontixanthobacter aquaemixtae]MXO89260.1 YeeE/YedE family protein [Pontixanthobacter aquaemixtae]
MISRNLPILLSGVLFGAGLTLGGMTDPARVRGFLNLFGDWDPTLAFVMGGAVIVMAIAWQLQPKLARPIFADTFALPSRRDLTPRLIGGSALFGIGWGVAGLCPGPGIAALVIEPISAAIFVAAMLAGMFLIRLTEGNA